MNNRLKSDLYLQIINDEYQQDEIRNEITNADEFHVIS
jgi:hypothetical protein